MGPVALSAVDWERVARARLHPLQAQIITTLEGLGSEASPSDLAEYLECGLSNASYHVRQLAGLGILEQVRTAPVRGALEHFYALAEAVVLP